MPSLAGFLSGALSLFNHTLVALWAVPIARFFLSALLVWAAFSLVRATIYTAAGGRL